MPDESYHRRLRGVVWDYFSSGLDRITQLEIRKRVWEKSNNAKVIWWFIEALMKEPKLNLLVIRLEL
jgi:hypothetical protein